MPVLSAFTPLGHLHLSSAPSDGEQIYRALVNAWGGEVNTEEGSRFDAWAYATALGLADVRAFYRRIREQQTASGAYEHLAELERERGIVPGRTDTIGDRQATLKARKKVAKGASRGAVEMALLELLGDNFLAYYTTKAAEIVNSPASLGDQPMNLQPPSEPRKLGRLLEPIVTLGSSTSIEYEVVAQPLSVTIRGPQPTEFIGGDNVVIGAGLNGIEERVRVTASVFGVEGLLNPRITVNCAKPHSAGEIVTSMPYPLWRGNQRQNLIIVSDAAAVDRETRRKVHELMRRMLRGTSTWSIVDTTSPTTAGPFRVGVGRIGVTPLGTVTFP